MDFDAITVAPYMGEDSIRPFLDYPHKWTIVLGLTSNKGAKDFEMQRLQKPSGNTEGLSALGEASPYLFEWVMNTVAGWGSPDNLMFVVGATQAEAFSSIRTLTPQHFYLVPGVGAQGGSLKEISEKAMNADCGLLVNASRAIIYASNGEDFAVAAEKAALGYASEMKQYLESAAIF
jgi:orotidine-5'-phosphate decarboxylase